jgi:hypothetical protein
VQDPALFNTSYSDALLVRAAYDQGSQMSLLGLGPSVLPRTGLGFSSALYMCSRSNILSECPASKHSFRLGLLTVLVDLTTAPLCCLQRFVDAAILAYECGMNEDSLRHELKVYKQSLEQQMAPPGMVGGDCCAIEQLHSRVGPASQCTTDFAANPVGKLIAEGAAQGSSTSCVVLLGFNRTWQSCMPSTVTAAAC